MSDRIGSIEPGKQADIVVHDASRQEWTPRGEVGLQLVWSADGRSVRDVLVAGEVVVRGGRCTSVNEEELRGLAAERVESLHRRAGITVPRRWPLVPSA